MSTLTRDFNQRLRQARVGALMAVLTILFGFALGGVFGALEAPLKADLAAQAQGLTDTVYGGDAAKLKAVLDKSWTYYKRAHLHGGAIGATALGLIVLLSLLGRPTRWFRFGAALALGLGGLGYSLFWLLAGRLAPSLGGTGAAKAALEWLAVPSAGLLILGLLTVLGLLVRELFGAQEA